MNNSFKYGIGILAAILLFATLIFSFPFIAWVGMIFYDDIRQDISDTKKSASDTEEQVVLSSPDKSVSFIKPKGFKFWNDNSINHIHINPLSASSYEADCVDFGEQFINIRFVSKEDFFSFDKYKARNANIYSGAVKFGENEFQKFGRDYISYTTSTVTIITHTAERESCKFWKDNSYRESFEKIMSTYSILEN